MSDTARELIRQLDDPDGWPDPAILEAIAAEGEAAVEPLLEVVRRDVEAGEESEALYHVLRLLTMVGPRQMIGVLPSLFRTFEDDLLDDNVSELAFLGPELIEPLLAIAADRSYSGYARNVAAWGARLAAGADPAARQRVGEVLRDMLADALARAGNEPIDEDLTDQATTAVCELADLADPPGRELIERAFAADLVEEGFIDRKDVNKLYERGGEFPEPSDPRGWLEEYRRRYTDHQEWKNRPAPDYTSFPVRSYEPETYKAPEPYVPPPPVETIRHTRERPGRNDPCWCGSGKKYKKCHLSQDEASS